MLNDMTKNQPLNPQDEMYISPTQVHIYGIPGCYEEFMRIFK